jgi:hypothetical protein
MKSKIFVGFFYAAAYILAAFFAAGSGHGTYIFFAPTMPYGFGMLFYPLLFGLLVRLESNFVRAIFVILLLTHYAVTILFASLWWNEDVSYLIEEWSVAPLNLIIPSIIFLVGEIYLLGKFITSLKPSSVELR